MTDDNWDLDKLMESFEKEVEARERAAGVNSNPIQRKHNRETPTAMTLTSLEATQKFVFCDKPHSSNSCRTITSPVEGKRILARLGRCFVCLGRRHISRDCRSTRKCTNCGGRHNFSIYVANYREGQSVATTPI